MIKDEFTYEPTEVKNTEKKNGLFFWIPLFLTMFVIGSALFIAALLYLNTAPKEHAPDTSITIETGESVKQITSKLEEASIVRSGTFLYLLIVFMFEPENIKASTYVFEEPITAYEVARQLALGDFDNDLLRFTHIEGERARAIAEKATRLLPDFDAAGFLLAAEPLEGKLFPDTYFIPENYTAEELLSLMVDTYTNATRPLQRQMADYPLTESEILVLASIIEREANSPESMKMVSGILQNRLAINMPLQADASIEYVLDKPLEELVPEDLKIDSPYNTYTNTGLPPTPIGNPGIVAIKAVLEPTLSDNYYYITDEEGIFHYSETYDQHLKNINLYLR